MNFHRVAFVALAVLACPFAAGCAEEEADSREAAYPVGYTVPRSVPSGARGSTDEMPPAPPAPLPQQAFAPPPSAEPVVEVAGAASGPEIAVGDEDAPREEYADSDPAALTDFRAALDPYGRWVEDASYGTVWVPSPTVVGSDFAPYLTAGRWSYDNEYVWVSDYPWGWAPFHYGRWVYGGGVGWEWIPGRRYAGSWVSWRWGLDDWSYVGWAPLPPTWCWHRGAAVGIGFVPVAPYAFVPTGDLFARALPGRVVAGPQVGVIAAHTRPWVPAGPAVAASPGLSGRLAARPQVVGGPPPSVLRIGETAVVHGGLANRGVLQARAFAHPDAAIAFGPAGGMARSTSLGTAGTTEGVPRPLSAGASSWMRTVPSAGPVERAGGSAGYAYAPRTGGSPAVAPSHFGGRLGAGFVGSPPDRPVYYGGAPRQLPQAPAFSQAPPVAAPFPIYRGNESMPTATPMWRGSSAAPAPAFRSNSSASVPAPAFRGGSAVVPAPAFHSAPAAPAFHNSSSVSVGGGFHGAGGGGAHSGGHR